MDDNIHVSTDDKPVAKNDGEGGPAGWARGNPNVRLSKGGEGGCVCMFVCLFDFDPVVACDDDDDRELHFSFKGVYVCGRHSCLAHSAMMAGWKKQLGEKDVDPLDHPKWNLRLFHK